LLGKLLTFVAVSLLSVSAAHAAILGSISVQTGTQLDISEVTKFSVAHFDMTGMRVTAHFSDNTSQFDHFHTITPVIGEPSLGIAQGSRFKLTQQGDTFESRHWSLENLSPTLKLTMLTIEGAPGGTIFDLKGDGTFPLTPGKDSGLEGTGATLPQGSERGWTFDPFNLDIFASDLQVSAIYSDIVKLNADAVPKGDAWATLTIKFEGNAGGLPVFGPEFSVPASFRFYADTDTFDLAQEPVPEPTSLSLCLGLGLFTAWRIRRNQLPLIHRRAPL
jgi:hypothetical protein